MYVRSEILSRVKVADEVWISTALLHRENASATDFSIEEIVERARKEELQVPLRPGVYVHVVQHCVPKLFRVGRDENIISWVGIAEP